LLRHRDFQEVIVGTRRQVFEKLIVGVAQCEHYLARYQGLVEVESTSLAPRDILKLDADSIRKGLVELNPYDVIVSVVEVDVNHEVAPLREHYVRETVQFHIVGRGVGWDRKLVVEVLRERLDHFLAAEALQVELHACAGDSDAEFCHSCPRELGSQIGEAIIEQEGVLLIILCIVALGECAAIFRRELVGIIKVVSQVNVHLNHGADIDHKISCDYGLGVLA
jgi:hypothetical protein